MLYFLFFGVVMSQNEETKQNEEVKEQNSAPEVAQSETKVDSQEQEEIQEEAEAQDATQAQEPAEDDVPTFEEVVEALAIKELEVERLKEGLLAGEKEIQELQSRLRSVSAAYKKEKEDQEAFKVRIERQMEYRSSRRRGEVVKVLFEPLENLRRSHSSLNKKDPESAVGIEMVIKAFMTGFTKLGLEEISPDGQKFDPNEHNALMAQPTPDPALDDVVLQTYSVGYRIEGIILQPAQVIVGKYDGPPIEEATSKVSEEEAAPSGDDEGVEEASTGSENSESEE